MTANSRLRAIAAIHRDPASHGSRFGWTLAAARFGLADLADRAANLQPPLSWQPTWTFDGRNRESRELTRQDDPILALDMSAGGRVLVSYDQRHHLRTWDTRYGSGPGTQLSAHGATAVAISPSGRYVVTGNTKGLVRTWDLITGENRDTQANNQPIAAVAISDDTRQVTAFNNDGTFLHWELGSGQSPHVVHRIVPTRIQLPPAKRGEVSHLITSIIKTTCHYVAVANSTGTVGLLPIQEVVIPDAIYESVITSAAWSGNMIVLGLEDGTVLLWNADADRTAMISQHDGPVLCTAISSDGHTIASGGTDGSLRVWRASPRRRHGDRNTGTRMMTVAGDAAFIVSGATDVYPLAVHTGELLQSPLQSPQPVLHVSRQLLDGRHGVLLHHGGGESSLWLTGIDSLLNTGKWHGTQPDSGPTITVLDSRLAEITSDADGTLSIRDITVERKTSKFTSGRAPRNTPTPIVAYARMSGRPIAATCGTDGSTVYIWDVNDQRMTDTIEVGARIWALELSADGYLLIGAGSEVITLRHISVGKK